MGQVQSNFGRYLKVGVIEDTENKEKLLDLVTFSSTLGDKVTSLPDYVSRMPEAQTQSYYLSGASKAAASSSPVLERRKKTGFDVLFAPHPVDELAVPGGGTFKVSGT